MKMHSLIWILILPSLLIAQPGHATESRWPLLASFKHLISPANHLSQVGQRVHTIFSGGRLDINININIKTRHENAMTPEGQREVDFQLPFYAKGDFSRIPVHAKEQRGSKMVTPLTPRVTQHSPALEYNARPTVPLLVAPSTSVILTR